MQLLSGSVEILDLRHFAAPALRPVLEGEGELWEQRLHWDYHASARLLMQYLDNHMLPGFAALESGRVMGYVFCVYEENKAVIGDVFALPGAANAASGELGPACCIEETLLRHLFELLLNSPHVDRIESQLLLHSAGKFAEIFRATGFEIFRRLYLVQPLQGRSSSARPDLPPNLELRPWREADLAPAARLICDAYRGHPDGLINDQYRSAHGSMRFLNNIVHYAGCGTFAPAASFVVVERDSRELAALVLGSRVSTLSGHLTQVCVHPAFRRRGLARMLLAQAASSFIRLGASEISLTVTEANPEAIRLYYDEGYTCTHSFDAAVWQRQATA
ncbi:Acetyltransferase, GNAT family [Candidatus Sulfotelmatomonas gaucii]|uniref:Acetyltransferase, GNAT family n=1 Tax=Candidatus Sulfuritelmatomonas gaucii TaxID=2043161 RepID=A0A2N9L4D2_9BACT|nr:Acetyltransferase, GNAT family [Candidatus Sulfotelmatomonas gaucii]